MKKDFFQNKKSTLGSIVIILLVSFGVYSFSEKYQLANLIYPATETQLGVSKNIVDDSKNNVSVSSTPAGSAVVKGEADQNNNSTDASQCVSAVCEQLLTKNLENQFIQIKGNLGRLGEISQKDGQFYLVKKIIENGNIKRHTIKAINLDTGSVNSRIIANHSIDSGDLENNLTIRNLTVDGDFIAQNYAGQTSITTLGTITNGAWQGSPINSNFLGSNVMLEGENISLLHNDAGYLTSVSAETDPIFESSVAHGITDTNVANWNSAYNWGNHALQGYITAVSSDVLTNKTWNGNLIGLAYGGTGTATGSITGTGALNFSAGGTNQNVTLTPSGTGYTILNGNVGIGTTSPNSKFSVIKVNTMSYPFSSSPVSLFASSNPEVGILETGNTAGNTATLRLGTVHATYYNSGAFIQAKQYAGLTFWELFFGTSNGASATTAMMISRLGYVGIGTTNPGYKLDVAGSVAANEIIATGVNGITSTNGGMYLKNYLGSSVNTHAVFNSVNSRGTVSAPTYLLNGDEIGAIAFREGTSGGIGDAGAGFAFFASENWSTSALGTRINFFTTPNGSTVKTAYLDVSNAGIATFVNQVLAPSFKGTGNTDVNSFAGNVGIGTTAPNYILDVQHATSKVNSKNGYLTNGADYAEYFYTDDTDLVSGETVCVDIEKPNAVKRCQRSGDNNVMGIVSTNPSIVGNGNGQKRDSDPHYKIIGMLGQVPAKVSSENGTVQIGDSLTSSDIPGYLRKANAGESTVGVAMQSSSNEKSTIQVLISRRNQSLTVEKVEEAVTENIAKMNIQDQITKMIATAKDSINNTETQNFVSQTQFSTLQDGQTQNATSLRILQKQMDDLQLQTKPIIDFYLALDLKNVLYKNALGNFDLLGGKITAKDIEALNTIKAKDIEATDSVTGDLLSGNSLELGKDTSGKSILKSGETKVEIDTAMANKDIKIYITPVGNTFGQVLYVDEISDGKFFNVKMNEKQGSDINFNWLIVK